MNQQCPSCGQLLKIRNELAGIEGKCYVCNTRFKAGSAPVSDEDHSRARIRDKILRTRVLLPLCGLILAAWMASHFVLASPYQNVIDPGNSKANDAVLRKVLPNLEYYGCKGLFTFYVARNVNSDNAMLYLAAAARFLRPEIYEDNFGKIELLYHENCTMDTVGTVCYRNGRLDAVSVSRNVDEMIELSPRAWEAIQEYDASYYRGPKNEMTIEEERELRSAVWNKYGQQDQTWAKRRRNCVMKMTVTQEVLSITNGAPIDSISAKGAQGHIPDLPEQYR